MTADTDMHFSDCCVDMESSGNIIVVKTISGTGSAVGEAIDGLKLDSILGTIAGDNTVLVVIKEGNSTSTVLESLRNLAGL